MVRCSFDSRRLSHLWEELLARNSTLVRAANLIPPCLSRTCCGRGNSACRLWCHNSGSPALARTHKHDSHFGRPFLRRKSRFLSHSTYPLSISLARLGSLPAVHRPPVPAKMQPEMKLTTSQVNLLKTLMASSAKKGNLANAGLVLEGNKVIASSESLVATNNDATAHSERMLVTEVGKQKQNNYTPGLTMVTVVEPCLMCMSACSQSGYKEIAYIIPAKRYVAKIQWMTDVNNEVNKQQIAKSFSDPVKLTRLSTHEEDFCEKFEEAMSVLLN